MMSILRLRFRLILALSLNTLMIYLILLSGVVSDNTVFTDHIMAAVMNNTHVVLKIESG